MLRKTLAIEPNVDHYIALAQILNDVKRHEEMEEVIGEAVEFYPRSRGLWSSMILARLQQKDFDGAIEAGRRAMALPNTSSTSPLKNEDLATESQNIAVAYDGKRDRRNALKFLFKAQELSPDPSRLGVIAHRYWMLGERDEAIRYFREAARLNPGGQAYNDLGGALVQLRRFEEALPWIERVLSIETTREHRSIAILWKSQALQRRGQWEDALQLIRQAQREDPASALMVSLRGGALLRLKRYAEAEEALRRTFQLQKTAPALFSLGKVLVLRGAFADGKRALQGTRLRNAETLRLIQLCDDHVRYRGKTISPDTPIAAARFARLRFIEKNYESALRLTRHAVDGGVPALYEDVCTAVRGGDPDLALKWAKEVLARVRARRHREGADIRGLWRVDPDLASVRDPDDISSGWRAFWAEVAR